MSRRVGVVGAGGHARVVVATLQAGGWEVVGLFDRDPTLWGGGFLGVPVLGDVDRWPEGTPGVVGIGDNAVRRDIVEQMAIDWVAAVHPRAYVHESVQVGAGTVVFAGAVIQPETRLGRHVVVNTSASVDHECLLDDFAQVGPGATLAGRVEVGEGALVGMASAILQGRSVGDWATVGAGAVVTRDVEAGTTVVGVPACARS